MPEIEAVEWISQDELRQWRQNVPDGHTRHAYEFKGPGGREDPDATPAPLASAEGAVEGETVFMQPKPLEPGVEQGRRVVARYGLMLANWARTNREFFMSRAKLLRATSPMQFSHVTDDQLADQLASMVEEKAKAAAERVYRQRGWTKPELLGMARERPSTAKELLLPGQKGRET